MFDDLSLWVSICMEVTMSTAGPIKQGDGDAI